MLKFLLIIVLAIYTFYRVASFLFRVMLGGSRREHFHTYRRNQKQTPEGQVHVDKVPRDKYGRKKGTSGDGEYVDFEEVK